MRHLPGLHAREMSYSYWRAVRLIAPLLLAGLSLAGCATFDRVLGTHTAGPVKPWLYKGSDVPVDTEWRFGTLPNGIRYAVRRNGVPPGQVSVRVRIDAGSLMETDAERGYAHFLEHLSFRGSTFVPDGEAKRMWQRLGATFGSDSNAQTSPTQTVYKLDLPSATRAGLDESLKILSGMMAGPIIDTATVDSERSVVMAEARESFGAGTRVGDATRRLFFAGQPLAEHAPIGTTESLTSATAPALRAFHDRWYRPENTVIVIAGDADPKIFEQMLRAHFAAWKGKGPIAKAPDFGRPTAAGPDSVAITEPSLPTLVTMAIVRPWLKHNDTIAYNQGLLRDMLALRVINRRLETRARAGGSFLQAQIDRDDVSRSSNMTSVSILPLGDDWRPAVHDVRTVIAEALTVPSSQADIDREVGEFEAAMTNAADQARTQAGSALADDIVNAVDIRETVASPQVALDVFKSMNGTFTPASIQASTRRLFAGVDTRALLVTPKPAPDAATQLAAVLAEDVTRDVKARAAQPPIGFDRLPKLGTPATVVKRDPPDSIGISFVTLSNGVRLVLWPNKGEVNRVLVTARFGNGLLALPTDRQTVAWAAPAALIASGIGDLGQEELDRLTSARQINMGFGVDEDAFELKAVTRAADLKDQLTLLADKLAAPGWDPNPVIRARAALLVGYDSASASPLSVLGRDLPGKLRAGDPRFTTPDKAAIEALSPQAFRAEWEPLLATGPIEVLIFGDYEIEDAIKAAAQTFGALPPRSRPAIMPAAMTPGFPAHNQTPLVAYHTGPDDQAGAILAYPTGGGIAGLYESRKLQLLTAIFNDRLFERFRQVEGASYSPSVDSVWPLAMTSGGYVVIGSGVKPERVEAFFKMARDIAADLASKPVEADELARAVGPMIQVFGRASSGNAFWIDRYSGTSWDRSRAATIETLPADLRRITPAELQETARKWLVDAKGWSMVVVPTPPVSASPAPPPR